MAEICLIHGPNINLLGLREPDVYGSMSYEELNTRLEQLAEQKGLGIRIVQSNHEGAIIDAIQDAMKWADGIIINPGAYTHYSYAIRDALTATRLPAIEVHISNVHTREEWRHRSVISPVTVGQVVGFGPNSYMLALDAMKTLLEDSHR